MRVDLHEFEGTFPYATELLGVYQPLLGWRGRRPMERVMAQSRVIVGSLVASMIGDPRLRALAASAPRPRGPDTVVTPDLVGIAGSRVMTRVHAVLAQFVEARGRMPVDGEWRDLLGQANLAAEIAQPAQPSPPLAPTPAPASPAPARPAAPSPAGRSPLLNLRRRLPGLGAVPPLISRVMDLLGRPGTAGPTGTGQPSAAPDRDAPILSRTAATTADVAWESLVSGTLLHLAEHSPRVLGALARVTANWQNLGQFVDPLAQFDPGTQDVVLSPVGLLQVYRQYFFELGSFVGSPVEHVWLSPGSSLELFETHTRRTVEERELEVGFESVSRSERESGEEDELSTTIAQQNGRNTMFGVGTSAGVNFGVVQSSATTNLSMGATQMASQQTAHRQMRRQSERLATEIRRNFKTTFRTSVQTEDTSSRRYVLSNTTDKLVNYELRRKMRRVGVQVQHVGTQLCWQVYVNDPGQSLGVGQLVHVASPADLQSGIPGPEEVVRPEPKDTELTVDFPFVSLQDHAPIHDYYRSFGVLPGQSYSVAISGGDSIRGSFDFAATPPGAGYRLTAVSVTGVERVEPNQDLPTADAEVAPLSDEAAALATLPAGQSFRIELAVVNFYHQPAIRFNLRLVWTPSQDLIDSAERAQRDAATKYQESMRRQMRAAYVNEVRERVRLGSNVSPRPASDLRVEERSVVFRKLIAALMDLPYDGREDPHVTSELVRSLFDAERMLYFVAPDWWRPRDRVAQDVGGGTLTGDDTVSWGGQNDRDRANYLITEDSRPAPLGASLGWLLQLDGDGHRNAFLNAPWVKVVLPIQPGREEAAINWLKLAGVEGAEGLAAPYQGPERELAGRTVEEALLILARGLGQTSTAVENISAADRVFENGFDPLEGGFRASGRPFEVYDQWIEVLPTDQIVAVEYAAETARPR